MTWVAVNQFPTIYDVCKADGRTLGLATIPRVTSDGPSGAMIQSSQMMCVSQDSENKQEQPSSSVGSRTAQSATTS